MNTGDAQGGELAARLLDALPQTQCTRCAYLDCAGYAQAMAAGQADINQCPPGGEQGVNRLGHIMGLAAKPLNPAYGTEGPRTVAFIDENWCIGCTLCINACPTDAIFGSNKTMHTVMENYCTGCELCIPVCPVDCIVLENASANATGWDAWSPEQANQARARYEFACLRRTRDGGYQHKRLEPQAPGTDPVVLTQKRTVIEAALARARAKNKTLPMPPK